MESFGRRPRFSRSETGEVGETARSSPMYSFSSQINHTAAQARSYIGVVRNSKQRLLHGVV